MAHSVISYEGNALTMKSNHKLTDKDAKIKNTDTISWKC